MERNNLGEENFNRQRQMVLAVASLMPVLLSMQNKQEEATRNQPESREKSTPLKRVNWETFKADNIGNNQADFIKCIRMPMDAFFLLHDLLKEDLRKNQEMGDLRGGHIESEVKLYSTLRYLGGGAVHDIRRSMGISKSYCYQILHEVAETIVNCPALAIKFPSTERECEEAAIGFESISFGQAIINCVAAIDGYLLHTNMPSKRLVGNQRQFYSGHYCKFGFNIQAACDHNGKFLYFAIVGPGNMNDRVAFYECDLASMVDNLPPGYCVIGDAAYDPSEHVTPIYYGVNHTEPFFDNFNYFASQLRIRVEMAFGLMQMKWRYLQRPSQVTRWLPVYVMAIARLHNFVVQCQLDQGESLQNMHRTEALHNQDNSTFLPSQPVDVSGNVLLYDDQGFLRRNRRLNRSHSTVRHQMASRIEQRGLVRPTQSHQN